MPAPKKYSDELRERATRLALESGRPIAQVARDLGIHKEALRTWVRQAKADGTPSTLTSAEREELKRLRGEVRELRHANEILKPEFDSSWASRCARATDSPVAVGRGPA
jgi:transposase